ncbi:hypothetical protein MOX02_14880 [Methylobacterium oxalidis]|uniref:Uncharacterized protein n=1 Tax=Methylobacterium oxalidis TaxID=944322 RepID=A0A512J0E4_9HYPH|nr:hypothetical protein MOX02_14880 [Methylobacterium oxalidis]GLS63345.1 hypothetical protein GCM10007888_17260 [Methylobacterium oxalidis]
MSGAGAAGSTPCEMPPPPALGKPAPEAARRFCNKTAKERGFLGGCLRFSLVTGGRRTYIPLAQFRTCLWPRVGWWASGQLPDSRQGS